MNHDEGNPIASEVEYSGMNDSLGILNIHYNPSARWLSYYLDYVEFLND